MNEITKLAAGAAGASLAGAVAVFIALFGTADHPQAQPVGSGSGLGAIGTINSGTWGKMRYPAGAPVPTEIVSAAGCSRDGIWTFGAVVTTDRGVDGRWKIRPVNPDPRLQGSLINITGAVGCNLGAIDVKWE